MQGGESMKGKVQTGLRIPEPQYDRIAKEAGRMGVSINALILMLVDVGFSSLTLGTEAEFRVLLHNLPDISG